MHVQKHSNGLFGGLKKLQEILSFANYWNKWVFGHFHAVTVIKSSELLVLPQKQYVISLAFYIKQSYKN